MDDFELLIKTELLKRGWTQRHIAKQLNLSDAAISMYIVGKSKSKRFNSWLKKNLGISLKARQAFTLMEMMISMVVISILMAASMPLITQFSAFKTGVDKNVMACITANDSSTWFTEATGATTLPAANPCKAAVVDTQYARGRSLTTSTWAAEHGTSAQQLMARKILRAACDQGGEQACDFFINHCWTGGSASVPYCDDTAGFADVTYYLHQDADSNTNYGANYVYNKLEGLLPKMIPTLLNEVFYACNNDQTPDANQNLGSNFACELAQPRVFIEGCNYGNTAACQYAYDNDYNKSCTQVKTAWSNAPTQTYKLTYDGVGSEVDVDCNMSSLGSAAITGCNASPYVALDCTAGYNNSYNRSCDMVISAWPSAPSDTYNLTSAGAPPTAPVATACTGPDPNCTDTVGALCPDGTKFAGIYNGKYYFVPTADEAGTYTWNNGTCGTCLGALDTSNGKLNSDTILAAVNTESPYAAAESCKSLNTASYLGYTDWYLPANNELTLLYNAGLLDTSKYWSSTERTSCNVANDIDGSTGLLDTYGSGKTSYLYYVRCVRHAAAPDASCPNAGNTCADTTKYAGVSASYYVFTTPAKQAGTYYWNNGTLLGRTVTGATSTSNGKANTDLLVSLSDNGAPYNGANACYGLNLANYKGYTDWFLPSAGELSLLMTNSVAIGGFVSSSYPYYLSSTETSTSSYNMRRTDQPGTLYTDYKENDRYVRCARKQDLPLTDCTGTPGSLCTDGTYYAGYYDGRYIFTTPSDESSTYTYAIGGGTGATATGATDLLNGNPNQAILQAATGPDYSAAAQACKSLNTLSYKGHTDWYLPSKGELNVLYAQSVPLGLSSASYWSSSENNSTYAYIQSMITGGTAAYNKLNVFNVRCVRDD